MRADPQQAVTNIASMDQVLSDSVASRRFSAVLLGTLAFLGLLLASVGVYGVISYGVSQRTREIGIRVALGARRIDVVTLVVSQGMKLLLLGVGMGALSAVLLTPLMSSLLFGVRPSDPVTFAGSAAFVALVAVLACYIPARRAASVDPIVALRSE
jgi:ABC-type antimicrobial peptide transport system permease subunit